jgi:hypothetical protein
VPIGLPDPVPKKGWRRKNTHGRANTRALTAAEVADRHLRAQECQDKKLRAAIPESVLEEGEEEVQVPATLEQEPPVSTAPIRLAGAQVGARDEKKSEPVRST